MVLITSQRNISTFVTFASHSANLTERDSEALTGHCTQEGIQALPML